MSTRRTKNTIAPLAISAVILVLLELASRLILSHIYDRKFDKALLQEHKYGASSGLRPNATGMVWGKPFHTDDMGGRKSKHSKKGKQKLLIIGDSVTEGVGVDDSLTFASIINDRLDTFSVEVVNISLIGWSMSDYRNVIDQFMGKDTSVKGVFLFYCLNDIYGKTPVKDMPVMANKGFVSTVNAFLQDRYATYKLIKLCIYQNSDRYYQYDQAFYKDTARVNAVLADLTHIKQVCDSDKAVFGVFILPYRSQFRDPRNQLPQQVLKERLKRDNINYLDLLPGMARSADPKAMYLFADEIHLSPGGHQAVANIIVH